MPHLRMGTNLPKSKIPAGVEHEFCKALSDSIKRPMKSCHVTISPDKIMSVSGTHEPCIHATLMSIGKLGIEENKRISKALADKAEETLGIPPDKMIIHFMECRPHDIGVLGSTVHELRYLLDD